MNFSHLFIDRPIFATVLSIFITLIGGVTYFTLPVAHRDAEAAAGRAAHRHPRRQERTARPPPLRRRARACARS